jgi:hypothetical protein
MLTLGAYKRSYLPGTPQRRNKEPRGENLIPILLWFRVIVMTWFLLHNSAFLKRVFLLPALGRPCRLVAVADALLGMVNNDLLLLVLRSLRIFLDYLLL